jgi:hypothetical protein
VADPRGGAPLNGRYQTTFDPGWAAAEAWTGDRGFEARVRAVLDQDAKQRDSVKTTDTRVLTACLLTAQTDRPLPVLELSFFDDCGLTPELASALTDYALDFLAAQHITGEPDQWHRPTTLLRGLHLPSVGSDDVDTATVHGLIRRDDLSLGCGRRLARNYHRRCAPPLGAAPGTASAAPAGPLQNYGRTRRPRVSAGEPDTDPRAVHPAV